MKSAIASGKVHYVERDVRTIKSQESPPLLPTRRNSAFGTCTCTCTCTCTNNTRSGGTDTSNVVRNDSAVIDSMTRI